MSTPWTNLWACWKRKSESKGLDPKNAKHGIARGIVLSLSLSWAVSLSGCKAEEPPAGLGASRADPAPAVTFTPRTEPAFNSDADAASKKMFTNGLRALRLRDFTYAANLFSDAERRYRMRFSESSEFLNGCMYYSGRCREGMLNFDDARVFYDKVPQSSAYRPLVAKRMAALSLDSDNDGYSNAWEEAEGTNPENPLSHP